MLDLRKTDGSDCKPDTLTGYHRSINRKLKDFDYAYWQSQKNSALVEKCWQQNAEN